MYQEDGCSTVPLTGRVSALKYGRNYASTECHINIYIGGIVCMYFVATDYNLILGWRRKYYVLPAT